MNLTKWLPLFEKCPELKSDYLMERDGCWWVKDDDGGWTGITVGVAAALIRDKAVWWLAHNSSMRSDNLRIGIREKRVNIELITHEPYIDVYAADPTEALRLACCKALDVEP